MVIRQEEEKDFSEVYTVIKEAFASAEHADGNEQDLTAALRTSHAFVPELSLVAEEEGRIIGHILFTKAEIGDRVELVLAPLSVLPGRQKKGTGAALIREGHKIAEQLGYHYCVVLGSETYYPRFGYIQAGQLGIQPPFEVPAENFMAIRLHPGAAPIKGIVTYAPEFGI